MLLKKSRFEIGKPYLHFSSKIEINAKVKVEIRFSSFYYDLHKKSTLLELHVRMYSQNKWQVIDNF